MQRDGSGKEQAFRTLYDRTHPQVTSYCVRRCASRSDALDAAADTYLVAWRRFADVPEGEAALLWLFATARRVVANGRRSARSRARLSGRLAAEPLPEPALEESVIEAEENRDVLHALSLLSPDDQELLRLTTFEQLPHAQVAELLGCSRDAVDARLYRARRRLADRYARVRSRGRVRLPGGGGGNRG